MYIYVKEFAKEKLGRHNIKVFLIQRGATRGPYQLDSPALGYFLKNEVEIW